MRFLYTAIAALMALLGCDSKPYAPIVNVQQADIESKSTGTVRAHVFISGIVQGVSYRASAQEEAKRLGGIAGWIRNLSDGRVEGLFVGPHERIDALLKWCEHGPPAARVDKLDVTYEKAGDDLKGFEVRPTK